VPEPFATLLLQATAQRDNLQTATNPGARWLFPGRRAGQPLHASHLSQLVRDLGIPALAGRTAALRQLVLQIPAPVVAQALGYHHNTTTRSPPRPERPGAATPPATTAVVTNPSDHQGIHGPRSRDSASNQPDPEITPASARAWRRRP
jgi:hypothetical protein